MKSRTAKSARLAGLDSVTFAEHAGDLLHRGRDLLGRQGPDKYRVDVREAFQPGRVEDLRLGKGRKRSGVSARVAARELGPGAEADLTAAGSLSSPE